MNKRWQILAFRSRALPFIHQAFDEARPVVWERCENTATFKPFAIGPLLRDKLETLVRQRVLANWRFDIEESWGQFSVVLHYVEHGDQHERHCSLTLP